MTRYLLRRIVHAVATVIIAVSLVFLAIRSLPNNPVLARYGQHAPPGEIEEMMAQEGWNDPLPVQLRNFLADLFLRGDLGQSFHSPGQSVSEELARRLPATLELTLAAMLLALPIGIAAGIFAALGRNRAPDYLCMTGAMIGVSVPVFFLGICLLSLFHQMPAGDRLPVWSEFHARTGFVLIESLIRGEFNVAGEALRHLCLPAIALSTIPMAIIARITRASMVDALASDWIRTARAKGASRWGVVLRHALPNAAIPITNIAGFQIGLLLSGAVLTETVFSWPGLGSYLVEAVLHSDYAVVQGGALVVAILFVVTNLILDVVCAWLDPRIRLT